jgi:hypothetical protein
MVGDSIKGISVVFWLAVALLNGTTEIAQSIEARKSNTKRSIQQSNSSSQTNDTFREENFFSLPIAQLNTIPSENPRGGNLRRRPVGEEEEFKPERLPIKVPPGIQKIEQQQTVPTPYRASPNISVITPSGYGADWGNLGVGFGFQSRTRFTDSSDGVVGLGFGLGDAQKLVGLQVGIALTDLSDPFNDGSISFKIHRRLPYDFSIAAGLQGGVTFGVTDGGSSLYGVLTKRFPISRDLRKPFSEIYTSVGVGGGQFRSESDINDGNQTVGVFGSVAVRVLEPVSVITEWTGQDMTIGVSIVPFKNLPFVIIPAVTDITGSAGDGARFIFGAGYSFSF